MPLWNFTTQKVSLKIKQLKYVWIIKTLTTFHLRRPKRRRYVNNFLSHFSFCRISPQVLCKFVFPVYFPKLYPIISYQSSFLFGKKIHNFLWQIVHKEWKYKYHSFGNEFWYFRSEKALWIKVLDSENMSLFTPPGTFGGLDAKL